MKSSINKLKTKLKEAENMLFKALPKGAITALTVIGLITPMALAVLAYKKSQKNAHPSSFTVMITNREGNSGGSGSVIDTSPSESKILTNAHVCIGALKKGGKIRKVDGEEHRVTGYYLSDEHDLCLLTVAADLKNSVKIASQAPDLYEEATITGHPSLMPNIINKGHVSGRMIIDIMTGVRKCTDQDAKDPRKNFLCMMFGIVPIIKSYESMSVSATIMPGSSGSAVLNSNNELAGVVFAGISRGLSYAFTVPYESVRNFLSKEMKQKQNKLRPWEEESDKSEEDQASISSLTDSINMACEDASKREKMQDICSKLRDGAKIME